MLYIGSCSLSGLSYFVSTGIILVLSVYWNGIANSWRESQPLSFIPHVLTRVLCCALGKPLFFIMVQYQYYKHECMKVNTNTVSNQSTCHFQVLCGERESVGAAC